MSNAQFGVCGGDVRGGFLRGQIMELELLGSSSLLAGWVISAGRTSGELFKKDRKAAEA